MDPLPTNSSDFCLGSLFLLKSNFLCVPTVILKDLMLGTFVIHWVIFFSDSQCTPLKSGIINLRQPDPAALPWSWMLYFLGFRRLFLVFGKPTIHTFVAMDIGAGPQSCTHGVHMKFYNIGSCHYLEDQPLYTQFSFSQ